MSVKELQAGLEILTRVKTDVPKAGRWREALSLVAEQKFAGKFSKWIFDHQMRQIPHHYHFHVRPLLW